jgi:hypothetical protein
MSKGSWAWAVLALVACGGGGAGATGDDDDTATDGGTGDDDDTTGAPGDDDDDTTSTTAAGDDDDDTTTTEPPPPPCLGVGFATASTDWTLPDPGFSDDGYGNPGLDALGGYETVACGRDRYASYAVLDLTADGVVDLVFTRNDCLDPRIGRDHWLVFEGGAAGFAATGAAYALPPARYDDAYGNPPFDTLGAYDEMGCGGRLTQEYVSYATMDLTGDGVLDLVRFRDDCDDPAAGTDHWNVFAGGATGFASTPIAWSLPVGHPNTYGNAPYDTAGDYEEAECGGRFTQEYVSYATMDLTGDGVPDLVRFRDDCDDPATGTDHWRVFVGGASGFASTSTDWALPAGHPNTYGNPPYDTVGDYEEADCGGRLTQEYVSYATMDLTGDGVLDLVRFRDDCDDPATGTDHWRVFVGGASGFASTSTDWALPAGHPNTYGNPPYDTVGDYEEADCGGRLTQEYVSYATMDLTGDGVLDLVRFRDDCDDPATGTDHWSVFPGGVAGFAATADAWSLPAGAPDIYGNPPYDSAGGYEEWDCGGRQTQEYVSFSALDLTGDGILDLVAHRDDCTDPVGVGRDHWTLFVGECAVATP